jgi:hypothetical protein
LIVNLVRALAGALVAGVLPGYFWAGFARRCDGIAERLAYSAAFSMATVPVIALVLARVLRTGVSLAVAATSIVAVAGSGAVARALRGASGGPAEPALPRPPGIRDSRVLTLIAAALFLAMASALGLPASPWLSATILVTLATAGLLAHRAAGQRGPEVARSTGSAGSADAAEAARVADVAQSGRSADVAQSGRSADAAGSAGAPQGAPEPGGGRPLARRRRRARVSGRAVRSAALTAVLGLTTWLAYAGVVRHDWPYLRGEDQFSHAVMTQQMLAHGSYGSYLVYPPGFSTLSAVICRVTDLQPLTLFPVLAPAALLLTTLGGYALATRLWGWEYGLAAAMLSGLVLVGPYASFGGGLYPDLLAAFFLMVMLVAALVTLYQHPKARSGLLVALFGGAVVLYHSVVSLYLILLVAAVILASLPYLLRRGPAGRALARAITLAVVALGVVCVAYAWPIYDLGRFFRAGTSARATVNLDIGSQPVLPVGDLLAWVGSPVVWLGVFGFSVLVATIGRLKRPDQVLAALTLLIWCVLMYLGSRTVLDGFPQRFERDVGAPLTALAALGLGLIVQSVAQLLRGRPRAAGSLAARRRAAALAGSAIVAAAVTLAAAFASNLEADGKPSREVLTGAEAAAGKWLKQHNTGGTIISTPDLHRGITNRAVLALGGYTGLQSYDLAKIKHPRSLPTAGKAPLLDSREVLYYPAACRSARIIAKYDVKFIFLYWPGTEADYAGFATDRARYRRVFKNSQIVIYAPVLTSVPGCRH